MPRFEPLTPTSVVFEINHYAINRPPERPLRQSLVVMAYTETAIVNLAVRIFIFIIQALKLMCGEAVNLLILLLMQ